MSRLLDHGYIIGMIFFTVYSQLIIRWQVSLAGELPETVWDKTLHVGTLLLNPWIISALVATFLGGVSWMLAMAKFEISYAYPFASLNYVLVLVAGFLLFHETVTVEKIVGCTMVILGIMIVASSH